MDQPLEQLVPVVTPHFPPLCLLIFFRHKKNRKRGKKAVSTPSLRWGSGGGERINIHDRKSRDKKRHRLAGYFLSVKVRTHLARLQLGKKWHCCCCCCCCCCCSNCSSCTILATWGHQLATVPDPPQRTVISFFLSLVPLILSTGYRPSPSWMAVHRSKCHPRQRKTGKKNNRAVFFFSLFLSSPSATIFIEYEPIWACDFRISGCGFGFGFAVPCLGNDFLTARSLQVTPSLIRLLFVCSAFLLKNNAIRVRTRKKKNKLTKFSHRTIRNTTPQKESNKILLSHFYYSAYFPNVMYSFLLFI